MPEASPASDPFIGRVLDGRYRVLSVIGAGGMGSVYRVEHIGIGKVMAVKVLSARVAATSDARDRFEQEVKVGGKIGHPNCVAVSDCGTLEDGSFYLVMELLQGESLGDVLEREGKLPSRRALHIARHVLRGLGHAHEHGVVHRDIKPDNIFLAKTDDDPDFAKILDFGIAKLIGESATKITQAGITVGTPAYLSPEQAFGGELDGRSDLYSLSIVLYEMLTGATPFGDRDLVAMLTAHAVADVPPMADIAPEVDALVRLGLAKTAAERIPTASDYVARIDALLGPRLSTATPLPGSLSMPSMPSMPSPTLTQSHAIDAPGFPLKKVATWAAVGILAVGAIAAIISNSGGSDSDNTKSKSPPKVASASASSAPKPDPTPPPKPDPTPTPPPNLPTSQPPNPDPPSPEYTAALTQLTKGKTCPARKAAVAQLAALGDPRAIPALKKARYRMRGGILGIGSSNSNSCLKADADAAIAKLSTPTGS